MNGANTPLNIMWNKVIVFLCVLCLTEAHKICKVPNGGAGRCVSLSKCKPLDELEQNAFKTADEEKYLRQSYCASSFSIKVCCPDESEWSGFRAKPVYLQTATNPSHNVVTLNIPAEEKPAITKPRPPFSFNSGLTVGTSPPITNAPITRAPVTQKPITVGSTNNMNWRTKEAALFNQDKCGIEVSSGNKIFGGTATNVDEYPWLALLEYRSGQLGCGGSLISSRFVLTAAHCFHFRYGLPTLVRLSEYNISTFPVDHVETDGGGFEDVTVTVIPVESVMEHSGYSKQERSNDIALIKLSKDAEFSDFIKPICLPTVDLMPTLISTESYMIVAGWGRDETGVFSDVKKHVTLPYVPRKQCSTIFPRFDLENVICAGGELDKDSCEGDSGGPLMYEHNQSFYMVGIVSYGPSRCGTEGEPGVYSNVNKYIEWINATIYSMM